MSDAAAEHFGQLRPGATRGGVVVRCAGELRQLRPSVAMVINKPRAQRREERPERSPGSLALSVVRASAPIRVYAPLHFALNPAWTNTSARGRSPAFTLVEVLAALL